MRAYASSAVHRPVADMVAMARRARALGFPALKVRFGRDRRRPTTWPSCAPIRDDVGDALELMVDCNQGWRMPWDVRPPWDVDRAAEVANELAAERVYWIEEPLHRGDYDGMAELRRRVDIRVAGGELTREPYEFAVLLERGCLDVFQPDCVCTHGISGLRHLAADVVAAGRIFTPHTWGNGIGLLANAHLTAGTVGRTVHRVPVRSAGVDHGPARLRDHRHHRDRRRRVDHVVGAPRPRLHARHGSARTHDEHHRHVRVTAFGRSGLAR